MKKIISVLLSLVLVITIGCFHANASLGSNTSHPIIINHWKMYKEAGKFDRNTTEKPELILGDTTIDGKVDATDALFALIYGLDMPFDETAYSGDRVSYINPYYYGCGKTELPGKYGGFTKQVFDIYMSVDAGDSPYYSEFTYWHQYYYVWNSVLVADVSNDGFSNAVDAMLILQYAVGKIDAFPRTDFSSKGNMFYVPWSDEWEPGMLWNEDIEEKTNSGYYSAFQ